jgi:hypothetical protein
MNINFSLIELISFVVLKNTQNTILIACLKQTIILTQLIVDFWNETLTLNKKKFVSNWLFNITFSVSV